MLAPEANVSLIGMPAVGKSTVGVLLAKALGRGFVDTDLVVQASRGRTLRKILAEEGIAGFLAVEESCVLGLALERHVIATGGSVVYADRAMAHLKAGGPIVHLTMPLGALRERIESFEGRGVVIRPGRSLEDLYAEREPLYRRWADLTIDGAGRTQDAIAAEVVRALSA